MKSSVHKKLLSVLLAICIFFSTLPGLSVSATEIDTSENSFSDDISFESDAQSSDTPRLDENTVPEIIGAENARSRNHVERMYDDEGDCLNTIVFRNSDGSRTMYLYDFPIKYTDENGKIQDTSLEIADTNNSAAPFRSESSGAVTTFFANLSEGITLEGNDTSLRLVPDVPPQALSENSDFSVRRLDEKTVEYPYGEATTIEYSLTYTGFKEDIVVSEYTGQTEYTFTLYTNGLSLTQIEGSYFLTDDNGTIQATIGDIIIFTADERNNALGQLLSETVVESKEYLLTIVLDPEYLSDPDTVYPIRIDPTIELNYDQDGSSAIEDMTIASETTYSASLGSLYIGTKESAGICRVLMRFPALSSSELDNVNVTSATVELRDLMCESTYMPVYCYPYTGTNWTTSSTWSSLTQSWGSQLSYNVINYTNGTALSPAHRYSFDITAAVQGWIDGDYSQSKGLIFTTNSVIENGTVYECRTFASYNRSSYKPSFTMTYEPTIELDWSARYIDEGRSKSLVATTGPSGQTVTWKSSDTSVATVSSTGTNTCSVTGVKAGVATITATLPDGTKDTCKIYVTIADGVYYIKNNAADLFLSTKRTDTNAYVRTELTTDVYLPNQMWQITHISAGKYVIRPLNRLKYALSVTDSNVEVSNIGASNSSDNVPASARWSIVYVDGGYRITHNGDKTYTMRADDGGTTSGDNVSVASSSTSSNYIWTFETAYGMLLRNTSNLYSSSPTAEHIVELGENPTLSDLNYKVELHGNYTNYAWSSSDMSVATVNSSTGKVTTLNRGTTDISLTVKINGTDYTQSYKLIVVKTFNLEVLYDNAYSTRYSNAVDRINNQMQILKDYYYDNFYVVIQYSTPQQFASYADENCYSTPTLDCDHSKDCKDSLIYSKYSIDYSTYHHKNLSNIMARIDFPDITETFRIAYIGHDICSASTGYCSRLYDDSNPMLGATYSPLGLIAITNDISEANEIKTTVHEFGHLFGAPDHYFFDDDMLYELAKEYGISGFRHDCIFGANKNDSTIINNLTICQGCMAVIESNINSWDHN